ncbi:FAD-binding domain protein [Moelleriella libera RCEF 2490]|uniref:FAD-binding domain protein n=1 Tax=Moelleriella libera RCEF 2490 TaxID=1081109 RepID=A0A168AE74_9HYPO|nr:FAD-binding domain protein [Moelleriella libera RCEF 2490]
MAAATTTAAAARKPILIAGAGLSSLLLGQSLLRARIPFHIFERDASISFRAQGYRLRLSTEGLDAIESVLSPELFTQFWDKCGKTGGGVFASLDARTGEPESESEQRPEQKQNPAPAPADKTKRETTSQQTGGAAATATTTTGSDDDDDDAASTRIKEMLHSRGGKVVGIARGDMRKLFMQGCESHIQWSHHVTGYELTGDGVRAIFADGSRSVEGALLVGGEGIYSKVARQLSGGKLKVYDTGARGIHGQAPTTAFRQLGEGTEAAFWKITCSTPSGVPEWPNEPRVTVIGDAVHSMTPAGGLGANTACRDSALLGRLLADKGGYDAGVTAAYEKEMRVYGSEAVAASYGMAVSQFGVSIDEATSPTV